MQNLTDHPSVEKYSEEFADITVNNFFENNDHISGQEILGLTPVRQVNLFVIKSLLFQWKKESEKLKSPYFNFNSEEVQKALSTFMNTVSRHIYVEKNNLRPLLKEATCDSILLIFFPYVYYTNLIENWVEEELNIKDLRQIKKYVKVNESLMNLLISAMEENNLQTIAREDAIALLNKIVEQTELSPADTEEFEQKFDQVHPFRINDFLKDQGNQGTQEKSEESIYEQDEIIDEEEPVEDTVNFDMTPEKERADEDLSSTINENVNKEGRVTLADIHEKQKIEKISRYISINQKFMFINRLFDKDWGKFEKAISFLDETNDKDEILSYLDQHAPAWREEGDEADEFRLVLEKKLGEPIE